jgi:hypothetical protein
MKTTTTTTTTTTKEYKLLLLKEGGQRLRKKLSLQNLGPKLSLKTTDVTPIKEILNSEF